MLYDDRLGISDYTVNLCECAFAGMFNCVNLEIDVNISITDKNSDTGYSSGIFMSSQKLTTVTVPDVIDIIPENTFADCISLTTLKYRGIEKSNTLSEKINHIGNYAFMQCYSMTEIVIPSSVKTMGASVFMDWGNMNYDTGETKNQKIVFDGYLPPDSAVANDEWYNGMSDAVIVEYKTKTVILDTQGGIGGAQKVEAMYGRPLDTVEAPKSFNEACYEFGGYFTASDGGGKRYYDKDMKCSDIWGEVEISADLNVLYAYWTKIAIPITLHFDENTSHDKKINVQFEEKFQEIDIEVIDVVGYTFNGFYSERNGGGIRFYDEQLRPADVLYTDLSIRCKQSRRNLRPSRKSLIYRRHCRNYDGRKNRNVHERRSNNIVWFGGHSKFERSVCR